MKRRVWLGCLLAPWGPAAWADPSAAERARIERLLDALAARKDIRFVRNGKEYTGAQAADFLRGKLNWQIDKVATAQDFIQQIGTRSTTSGRRRWRRTSATASGEASLRTATSAFDSDNPRTSTP